MSVTFSGGDRLRSRLERYSEAQREALNRVVNTVTTEVFNESQRRVAVDTGNLKGSGRQEPSKPETLEGRVSYGGTAAEYALAVHESHPTASKFLTNPAREAATRFKALSEQAIKDTPA